MTKEHGVAATRGHLENNGGLRGHSVDKVFPYIVLAMGNPHLGTQRWYVQDPAGNMSALHFRTARLAESYALVAKSIGARFDKK